MSRSRIAEVQPLSGFDKSLYYKISREIADQLEVGSLVRIPLGTRSVLGLIFSLNPTAQLDGLKLKKDSIVGTKRTRNQRRINKTSSMDEHLLFILN